MTLMIWSESFMQPFLSLSIEIPSAKSQYWKSVWHWNQCLRFCMHLYIETLHFVYRYRNWRSVLVFLAVERTLPWIIFFNQLCCKYLKFKEFPCKILGLNTTLLFSTKSKICWKFWLIWGSWRKQAVSHLMWFSVPHVSRSESWKFCLSFKLDEVYWLFFLFSLWYGLSFESSGRTSMA